MWQGWLSFIIGIWLIISGMSTGLSSPFNIIIMGIAAAILGLFYLRAWEGMTISIIGLWLILCGVGLGLVTSANFILSGILISIFSLIKLDHLHRGIESRHKTS
jgi:hypothetical protein